MTTEVTATVDLVTWVMPREDARDLLAYLRHNRPLGMPDSTFDGLMEALGRCSCPTLPNGDMRCHRCGEYVNKRCWNCKTPRGEGRCPTTSPTPPTQEAAMTAAMTTKEAPSVVCPHDPPCRRLDSGWPACAETAAMTMASETGEGGR